MHSRAFAFPSNFFLVGGYTAYKPSPGRGKEQTGAGTEAACKARFISSLPSRCLPKQHVCAMLQRAKHAAESTAMPGARTHDLITVVTGVAIAPLTYTTNLALGISPELALRQTAIVVGAHLLSGIMFSPDLDLDSAIDNRWGVFYWLWRPYMWIVPHRSRLLSHGLVIPPLLRLLYFYWMIVGLLIGSAWVLGRVGIVLPNFHLVVSDAVLGTIMRHPRDTWSFLIGFITGSAAHSVADWLVTGGKHYLRRLGFEVRYNDAQHDQWRGYRRRARY